MRASLATLVDEFRVHSADTAVVAHRGNRSYRTTYSELATMAGRFAAELERRGIRPGDRVVLWGANSAEWIAAFFGCILRAVIAVPLDAAGAPDFAARVIRDTAPKLIVGDAHLLTQLQGTEKQGTGVREQGTENAAGETKSSLAPNLKGGMWGTQQEGVPQGLKPVHVAASDGTAEAVPLSETEPAVIQFVLSSFAELLPAEPLFTPSDAIQPHTPFQIVFTSGTTAEPRGIVHTHRNILVSLQPIENEMQHYLKYERIFHPLRFLHLLPLSHVFGQFMGLWCPALLGAEVHFAEEFEPARIVELIRRERVSVLIAVPRVLQLLRTHLLGRFATLAAQIDASDGLSLLKKWWRFRRVHHALGWKFWAVISGGATLPAELEAFWNRLGFALIQGYGMTETAALVTLNHPFHIKEGSIGKPMQGHQVRLSADGEILVRGDMLAEATWQGGAMHKREGEWLATGDLATTGASGDLKFLGRKGDVIVTSAGLNIHPADLETALTVQPGIRAAAVVACDLNAGPEPVAVVLTTLADAELQAAVDAANRSLAEFQQIRRVLRWPELQFPFTSTGKLIRRQVAAWACGQLGGNRAATIAPTRDSLLGVIAEVTGEPIPSATDPNALRLSEDLHLDSLGRVQLQSALEQRFSLELEDDDLAAVGTVAELRALLEVASSPAVDRCDKTSRNQTAPTSPDENTASPAQPATDNLQPATPEHLYPRWPWSWPIQTLRVLWLELIARPLIWLLAAPRVSYAATLEPRTLNREPLLIICNHITSYDGAFVINALPRPLRHHIAAAMSGEMLLDYRNMRNQPNWFLNLVAPGAYWLLTALYNVFPLPQARGFRRSFAHAGEAMDRGYSVLIFPEGTRSQIGRMNAFRPGIGLLAQQSRVPILPIALVGLYHPEPRRWFHSGRIEVRIGKIIPAATEDTDPAALTTQLQQALHALLEPRDS